MLIDLLVCSTFLGIGRAIQRGRQARAASEARERIDKLRAEQARREIELEKQRERSRERVDKLLAKSERLARQMRMVELPKTCPGCGAPVRGDVCEYCGTEF